MPTLPQQTVEQGIKSLKEVGRQECMYYMRSDDSPVDYALWKSPEDTPFTRIIRNALGSWVSALLRYLVVVSSACRPELRRRDYHMAWLIDSKGDDGMGLKSNRGQVVVLIHRSHEGAIIIRTRKVGVVAKRP